LKIDEAELERRRYTQHIQSVVQTIHKAKHGITRQQCVSRLSIPGQYFINRGWSSEILKKFDVGTPKDSSSPMRGRTVVPIYDDTGQYLIGATARSLHEKCQKCRMWHDQSISCPPPESWAEFCKWRNSAGFQRESCLYNYWNAKGHIKRTGTIALVEGPGDLWRLEEAGIELGVAMLGTSLSDQQQVILEMSGAMNVVSLLNEDDAGREATERLREQLKQSFRFFAPKIGAEDLGVLSPANVRKAVMPTLEKICR